MHSSINFFLNTSLLYEAKVRIPKWLPPLLAPNRLAIWKKSLNHLSQIVLALSSGCIRWFTLVKALVKTDSILTLYFFLYLIISWICNSTHSLGIKGFNKSATN